VKRVLDGDPREGSLPDSGAETSGPGGHDTSTRRFGTGRKARVAAMRTADALRDRGVVAAALFKPSMGGWIVQVWPGEIRRRA
jgi:hypothetical protein